METGIHELTAGYALDALDADERAAYEAHLPGCETCQQELGSFWETTEALAVAASGPAPSPALRERILADAARGGGAERRPVRAATAPACARCSAPWLPSRRSSRSGSGSGERMSRANSTTLARRSSGPKPQRPCSQTRARSPLVSRQARDVSSSAPTGRRYSSSTASIPHPQGKPTRCGSCRVAASRTASPAGLFPGRDGREIVAIDGTVQAGDLVAVTVEPSGGVDSPTTAPIVASDTV